MRKMFFLQSKILELDSESSDPPDLLNVRYYLMDFNSNGKQDILLYNSSSGNIKVYEYISSSVGFRIIESEDIYSYASLYIGDFNGDGNGDILYFKNDTWYVKKSTGKNFLTAEIVNLDTYESRLKVVYSYLDITTNPYTVVKDIDGDGISEVIHSYPIWKTDNETHNKAKYVIKKYDGNDFIDELSFTRNTNSVDHFWGHVNSSPSGYWRDIGESRPTYISELEVSKRAFWEIMKVYSPIYEMDFTETHTYKKLNTLKTTFSEIVIDYNKEKLNLYNKYRNPTDKSEIEGLFFNSRVTIGLVKTVKFNHISLNYKYNSPRINYGGKGFLGFAETTVDNITTGLTTVSERELISSHQVLMPRRETTKKGSTILSFSEQKYDLETPIGDNTTIYRPQLNYTLKKNKLNKTGTKTTYLNYDSDGNPTNIKTEYYDGDNLIPDYYQQITTNYTNEGSWGINYLPESITKMVTNGDDTVRQTTTFEYNSNGSLHRKTIAPDSTFEMQTSYDSYDEYGNVTSITASTPNDESISAQASTMNYTDDGRFLESKTTAGMMTSFQYDLTKSQLIAETSPSGLTTRYFYNALGQKYKTLSTIGVESYTTLNWAVNDTDAPDDAMYYSLSKTSGIAETRTYFNKKGQVLRTLSYGFDGEKIYTDKEYDSKDRLYRESLPYFKEDSELKWTTYTYNDPYERLSEVTSPDGTKNKTIYDDTNRKVTSKVIKDGVTQQSIRYSNALGQTTISEDNMENKVHYVYDIAGRLKESWVNDQTQHKTIFTYDSRGNRLSILDPDAGTISSTYDALGRPHTQTNARGHYSIYNYDDLGRIHTQTTKESVNGLILETLEYNYLSTGAAIGQLNWIKQDGSIKESYDYDELGRLKTKTEHIDNLSFTHSHTYDDYGRMDRLIYPSGFEVKNIYNDNGDLWQITSGNQVIYENTEFSALGALEAYNIGTRNVSLHYDNIGRLDYQGCSDIQSMSYSYDPMNNLKYRVDDITNQKEAFDYDNLNRLTGINYLKNNIEKPRFEASIDYDETGNILSKSGVGSNLMYGENGKPHALTSINTPMGYQPPKQDINYTYFNKVKSIDQNDGEYTYDYTYGIDHQRRKTVYKENGVLKRTKYYIGNYEKVIEEDGDVVEYHYLNANDGLFGIFVKTNDGNGELKYILSDHLGSLTTVLDDNGDVEQAYSYDAWGKPRLYNNWTEDAVNHLLADRGFTGHEHLPSVFGLIDMNGRMYDPILGRFLSPDPYVQAPDFAQNFNRYAYCWNNPLLYTDPSGEFIGMAAKLLVFVNELFYSNSIEEAWSKTSIVDEASNCMQYPIYSKGNTTITAGVEPFSLGVSARIINTTGDITTSANIGYGFAGFFAGVGINYHPGDHINIGIGGGYGSNSWSVGGSFTYDGYGAGYYYTKYGDADSGISGTSNPQPIGGVNLYFNDISFKLENDFLARSGDKWRSNAWELRYKDFAIGNYVYNNDPEGEDGINSWDINIESKLWGRNRFSKKDNGMFGGWKNGKVFSSPLYFSVRVGNRVERVGYNHSIFQDATQNFIHKYLPFGRQNFYTKYNDSTYGMYYYSGWYNPYSIFGK